MLGNRVPGLNRPKALPTEGLGMVSKSHLTVKPVAKDSAHHHSRGESQSLGHRRFTSQSYSALTSPSLSAYDGEGGAGLSEVDEFGGLNGLGRPQTPYSPYSPTSTFSSLPSPEVSAVDKLPGKVVIPNKFQRRVASDSLASYGSTRALTPDPEASLQSLEEEEPLVSADGDSRLEAESTPEPQPQDDPEESEIQPLAEPTPELQISTPETPTFPNSIHPSQEGVAQAAPEPPTPTMQVSEPASESIPVVDVAEEEGVEMEDIQRSSSAVTATQDQDQDPVPEVSRPNPISIPLSPVMVSEDVSPPVSSEDTTPPPPTPATGVPSVIEEGEQPASELVEEVVPSVDVARGSNDLPTTEEIPASPTLAFPLPPIDTSLIDGASSRLQTPPESPTAASSILTSVSDQSDSTIDYQSVSKHPDPDHDLFVLPLPKDDEVPPRPIVQEVEVPQSMHQVLASPLPTLQAPFDFPTMTGGFASARSSDPDISFTGDESLALDASQAEIVIAQSEVIRPASPTLLVAMPSPSPTTTAFRVHTPPPQEPLSPLGEVDVSPPRIRKKLYANHSVPTSFKDTLSPPPTQRSFSAVVHQKKRTSTHTLPSNRVDPPAPQPPKPANAFMTPKKKQSLFTEPVTLASPGSELMFLAKNAAALEARLEHRGDSSGDEGWNDRNPTKRFAPFFPEPLPRSTLGSGMTKAKSASTPTLVSASVTTPGHIPPVPDLVYDDRSSNSGLSSNPRIPPFLPQLWSRKSGAHEDADRRSLAPSHKSRKSEKSAREKDRDTLPRARKLSARLRSLASSSTNSLKSFGRPSLSSETSVSFDSPTTVSIEPMTPQDTGSSEGGRLGLGIGSPGSRSQISQESGSEWNSPPRRRDVLGRASSFADRLLSRTGKTKSGFLENSQGNRPCHRSPLFGAKDLVCRFGFEQLFEPNEAQHGLWKEGFSRNPERCKHEGHVWVYDPLGNFATSG